MFVLHQMFTFCRFFRANPVGSRLFVRRIRQTITEECRYSKISGQLIVDKPPNWYKVKLYAADNYTCSGPSAKGLARVTSIWKFSTFQCRRALLLVFSLIWKRLTSSQLPGVAKLVQYMNKHMDSVKIDFSFTDRGVKAMDCACRPPDAVRGMKRLDRTLFQGKVQVAGIKVPMKTMNNVMKKLRKEVLSLRGLKPVVALDEGDVLAGSHKLVLLDPKKHSTAESLSHHTDLFKENEVELSTFSKYDIDVGYENWPADETLRSILPEDLDSVSGYTLIGHIIHLNLKDHHLEYKELIGEVLLDKIPTVRTVVNKLDTIDNTFRNFKLEVLAGESDFITTARENGCAFEMDFSKVYWNSRLSTEHQRIIDQLEPNDVLYDVFAGIGPFAVPAAKKKCAVIANDLNPESYKWLQHNMKKNKIKSDVVLHNLDGREFIKDVLKPDIIKRLHDKTFDTKSKIHVVMNLPALAIEFLDAFPGLLESEVVEDGECFIEPIVHCYCFSKEDNYTKDVKERAEKFLGVKLPIDHLVRYVRHVAPNKDMLCAEFRLQREVLVQKFQHSGPPMKKLKSNLEEVNS